MNIKRIFVMLIAWLMLIVTSVSIYADNAEIWDGSIAVGFESGDGSQASPYIIVTASQLAYLAHSTLSGNDYGASYIKLGSDIYLNDTSNWQNWENGTVPTNVWTCIGSNDAPFCGNFDGDGHTVYGMFIDVGNDSSVIAPQGLFGCVRSGISQVGEIKNTNVASSYVNGYSMIGGIVGSCEITNVVDCTNYATISGTNNVGGIVGHYNGSGNSDAEVYNCINYGKILGRNNFIGGIVGGTYQCYVSLCGNDGTVSGNNYVAGIVGGNDWNGLIDKCFNNANISGSSSVAGIAGYNNGQVYDSYNAGTITGDDETGGITGSNLESYVKRCYNIGDVNCDGETGPILGIDYDGCSFQYGYYLAGSASLNGYGTSLTEEQLQSQDSYNGFDFEQVWFINPDSGYAYAQLRDNPHVTQSPEPILGDANGNGELELFDANLIMRYSLGIDSINEEIIAYCDVDGNGMIDITDALLVMRTVIQD